MPRIDLFNFFRIWLGWIVTIYATIIAVPVRAAPVGVFSSPSMRTRVGADAD